jgi:hypothetical protein
MDSTPGFTPLLYNKFGGEPQVKPGVWHPEMWAMAVLPGFFLFGTGPGQSCGSNTILFYLDPIFLCGLDPDPT